MMRRRGNCDGDDASYHSVTMVTARFTVSGTCRHWIASALPLLSFLLAAVAPGRSRVSTSAAYFCANRHEKMRFSFHPNGCYDLCIPQGQAQIQL